MKIRRPNTARTHQDSSRSGAAMVEFAVCLPLLLVLVLASIQACTSIFLKQTLSVAAYEGIRAAVKQDATPDQARAAAEGILENRGVEGAVVEFEPRNFTRSARGSWVSIVVSAPVDPNSVVSGWFNNSSSLASQATMMKEF